MSKNTQIKQRYLDEEKTQKRIFRRIIINEFSYLSLIKSQINFSNVFIWVYVRSD